MRVTQSILRAIDVARGKADLVVPEMVAAEGIKGRPFNVGRTEVTNLSFLSFLTLSGHEVKQDSSKIEILVNEKNGGTIELTREQFFYKPSFCDEPVACVSDWDIGSYIKFLRQQTGRGFRLLTEAEWNLLFDAVPPRIQCLRVFGGVDEKDDMVSRAAKGRPAGNAFRYGLRKIRNIWERAGITPSADITSYRQEPWLYYGFGGPSTSLAYAHTMGLAFGTPVYSAFVGFRLAENLPRKTEKSRKTGRAK
jgi:hypothetical protein